MADDTKIAEIVDDATGAALEPVVEGAVEIAEASPTDEGTEQVIDPALRRENKLSEVIEQHNLAREQEQGRLPEDEQEQGQAAQFNEEEEEGAEEPAPARVYKGDGGEWLFERQLDGKTEAVPLDKVTTDLAEEQRRLKAREKELDDYAQLIEEQAQAQAPAQPQSPATTEAPQGDAAPPVPNESMVTAAKALIQQIYDGETDQAAEALAQIYAGAGSAAQPNMDEISASATQAAVAEIARQTEARETQRSINEGMAWARENYPDLMKDKMLFDTIDHQTIVIGNADPTLPPVEIIKKATLAVAEKWGAAKPNTRLDNKRTMKPVPATRSAHQPAKPEPKEIDGSPKAVAERMAVQRKKGAGLAA